jgi:hypothetical protein
MTSEITSLLQHGWANLWKTKTLWIFSSLVLIDPLVRVLVPIPQNESLSSSLFYLLLALASIYFMFMSQAGVSLVAYHITIGKPLNFETAFQNARELFWRVVGISFLLALLVAPYFCTVFIASYKEPFQMANLAHNLLLFSMPLSIFAALWYFAVTEIIAHDSKIGKSLRTAWAVFTSNFVNLVIIGVGIAIASHLTNVFVSMVTMLAQNSFDFVILSKFDFISPHLSVTENNLYKLASTIAQAPWGIYSTSVFTFAYLKYSGAKMNKQSTSWSKETA